jgi:hypothetical protein
MSSERLKAEFGPMIWRRGILERRTVYFPRDKGEVRVHADACGKIQTLRHAPVRKVSRAGDYAWLKSPQSVRQGRRTAAGADQTPMLVNGASVRAISCSCGALLRSAQVRMHPMAQPPGEGCRTESCVRLRRDVLQPEAPARFKWQYSACRVCAALRATRGWLSAEPWENHWVCTAIP